MKNKKRQKVVTQTSQITRGDRKPYDELTILDDFMFCKVMQDEKLCKELLRRILGEDFGTIGSIDYQETVDENYTSKGIRLDIWVTTVEGRVFDIEMQATRDRNLARRTRYYQSSLDRAHLEKNQSYKELPDSYIIFLCPYDYSKKGLPVYTYRMLCLEDKETILEDGATRIILNSTASEREESAELRAVLDYMNGKVTDDPYIEALENAVALAKRNEEWRKAYNMMTAMEMDARSEGREEGREEIILHMLTNGRTAEEISDFCNFPIDEIRRIEEKLVASNI